MSNLVCAIRSRMGMSEHPSEALAYREANNAVKEGTHYLTLVAAASSEFQARSYFLGRVNTSTPRNNQVLSIT